MITRPPRENIVPAILHKSEFMNVKIAPAVLIVKNAPRVKIGPVLFDHRTGKVQMLACMITVCTSREVTFLDVRWA